MVSGSSNNPHHPSPIHGAEEPFAPGTRVRDYVIEQFIASGGFGSVYRARDTVRERLAALKLLHGELRAQGDSFTRFLREAQVLERIRHPNIIEIYDSGTLEDGRAFVVTEYLFGRDLAAQLAQTGALSPEQAVDILGPVCDALSYSHAQGVIHRDIKASNIFLSEQMGRRRIVLLDFGLAKLIEQGGMELTTPRMSLGTPSSMSPEQIRGDAVDGRSDVYALGALVFHMLTGQPPFAGKSHTVMQYMHLHGQRPRPSSLVNVSPAVDEVISQAMAPEREARHAGPEVFFAAFRDAVRTSGAPRRAPTRRARHTACRALAVYVDVRIESESSDDARDEVLLDETDAVLSAAETHLLKHNFHIGLEGSSSTLYVRALSLEPDVECRERRDAILAVAELHRALMSRMRAQPSMHVNLCMHSDYALVQDEKVKGGDLMRLERWAPDSDMDGVVGSPEVFADVDLDTESVSDKSGLLRLIERSDKPAPLSLGEQDAEQMLHAQMMAHLGRQLAEIVHDLRSPLTVVLGNIDLVLQRAERGAPIGDDEQRALHDAMTAAHQLKDIIATLLGASAIKSYSKDRRKIAVRMLVENAVMLARGETRRKAAVKVIHDRESHVMGSPGRLTQVLVNLLVNAAQAIREYGEIVIRTGTTETNTVQITIHDTGVGMTAGVQERIFEPFFTTKDIQSGTGLGLALVREIILEHDGTIAVSSEPGAGSCFTITLPAA